MGKSLTRRLINEIINDVVAGHYSNIEITTFVFACAGDNLTVHEMIALTKAMIATFKRIP